ncbi:X-linked retinitis pigmentosa GTPase regulator-interacting protein 1 isoform X2 [Ambystoma mexicanum]|uniref:X-linked retinitis pigmentosa GTPase regulator-interacting protein 1 isoform X2 n=1 Tax=Ambystoma mexicanum TaxID=8296 RepID=UPI0037E718C5
MSVHLTDETAGDTPVRDTDSKLAVIRAIQDVSLSPVPPKYMKTVTMKEKDMKIRQRVARVSREELEDRFLRLHEENLLLKEHAQKQESKIKRMGTKLLRLVSERKSGGAGPPAGGSRWLGRDLAAEEAQEELRDRVKELERKNEALRHRLAACTRQLQIQGSSCRHCPYGNILARTDSGLRDQGLESHLPEKAKRGLRVQGPAMRTSHTAPARYGEPLLSEAARAEIERLAQLVQSQSFKMAELERSSNSQKGTATPNIRVADQQAEEHRSTILENVGQIRLQKQLWEKDTALRLLKEEFVQLQEAYEAQLQEKQDNLKEEHNALLAKVEDLSAQLKSEQMKVVALDGQLASRSILQSSLEEFQGRVSDLEKERDLLKDNYDTLLESTLDLESQRSWKPLEQQLRDEILQLEKELEREISAKKELKEKLEREEDRNEELKKEVGWMQLQLIEQKQEALLLQGQVGAILSSTPTRGLHAEEKQNPEVFQSRFMDRLWSQSLPQAAWEERVVRKKAEEKTMVEKEEGTWMYNPVKKLRKMESGQLDIMQAPHEMEVGHIHSLASKRYQVTEMEHLGAPVKNLQEMEAEHAETILELEKTRDMLILQHKINKDYQEELEAVMLKAQQEKRDREEKELKAAQLLDLRGSRIQRLEGQLKDIAYGTQHQSFRPSLPSDDETVADEVPKLQRGENLFELHIRQAHLTSEALRQAGDLNPAIFCTYAFYDFETHATPVVHGPQPVFSFTSQYAVRLDEPFLQYLQCATARLDLHMAEATDHRMLAACFLKFGEVLDSGDCVHGTAELNGPNGENFGMLEYWMRLRFPIPQTLQLNKERIKALGYISANVQTHWGSPRRQHMHATAWGAPDSGVQKNELVVRLEGCSGVRSRWLGSQPSPYAIYRFFDFPDHDTPTVPYSNNPHFGDHVTFPIPMTSELDRYLRAECLWVYCFDDEDSEPGCYLGKAKVPLLNLAHGRPIKGDFVLNDSSGNPNGSINLSLGWKFPYKSPGDQVIEGPPPADRIHQQSLEALIEREKGLLRKDGGVKDMVLAQGCGGGVADPSYRPKGVLQPKVRKVTFYERKPPGRDLKAQSRSVATSKGSTGSHWAEHRQKIVNTCSPREAEKESERTCKRAKSAADHHAVVQRSGLHDSQPYARHELQPVKQAIKGNSKMRPNPGEEECILKERLEQKKAREFHLSCYVQSRQEEKAETYEEEVEVLEEEMHEREHSRGEDMPAPSLNKRLWSKEAGPADMNEDSEQSSDASGSLSTDSDDVIVVARSRKVSKPLSEQIRIEVGSLSLDPLSDVAADSRVQRVYVEYRFPDLPLEETETPVSLRKPTAGEEIHFNFSKVIHVDRVKNEVRRDFLYGMLEGLDEEGEEDMLKFTVVSDPMNELEDECEEVGYAYLDLRQILVTGSDVLAQHLEIFNVPEQDTIIGTLTVSVEAVEALRAVYWERKDRPLSGKRAAFCGSI